SPSLAPSARLSKPSVSKSSGSKPPVAAASAEAQLQPEAAAQPRWKYGWAGMIPWGLTHLMVFGAIWSGVTWQAVAACVGLFFFRIWAVTAIHHRYFSHRTYETSRVFQFILAWCAQMSVQRGVLWWAAHHRAHHLYSD